ncbi:lysostaphin resistance A-like protein [Isoptericola sp. NPDC019693]|uniref:CPBP family intramembrane glutamic endopeptidase n=1 Tax=Isoptericola sp. NPDC019693 TaxID=3364009 RepID=UPI00379792C9
MALIRSLPWVQAITEGRRRTPILLTYVIGILVAVFGVQIIIGAGLRLATGTAEEMTSFTSQVVEALTDVWPIVVIFLWVAFVEKRPVSSLGFRDRSGWLKLLLGFILGGALIALAAAPAMVSGALVTGAGSPTSVQGAAALGIVVATVPIWLIQGSSEEIVFRGFLLQRHLFSWPSWLAIVFLAALFAFVHPGGNLLGKLNITLFGVLAALIVLQQGSLWVAMGVHAGWNFVQGNVLGLAVSGEGRDYSIFRFVSTDGADGITSGGEFGTETSYWATIVLLISIGVAWALLRRRLRAPRPAPADELSPV